MELSKNKMKYIFRILIAVVFLSGCVMKSAINLELSETPKNHEELEAEKLADKALYDVSNYFLKKAINSYSSNGNWVKVVQNYVKLGNNYRMKGEFELALKYLNLGLEVALEHSGYKYAEIAIGYHKLAFKHLRNRNYEKAIELYKKALAIRIATFGKYNKEVSRSYNSIALVYRHMGDLNKAGKYYYKSLLIKLRRFEKIDKSLFSNFKFIDSNRIKQQFYAEAKRVLAKSLKVYLETYGGSHHLSGIIYENIGIIYTLEGDFERAMSNFHKALKIRIELFGEESLEVADTYHDIGTALILKREYESAEKFLTDSLNIKVLKLGKDHLFVGDTLYQLGNLFFNKGDYDNAIRFLQDALVSLKKGFKPHSVCNNPILGDGLYLKKDLLKILNLKAKAFAKKYSLHKNTIGDLQCSLSTYTKSLELINLMRNRFKPDEYNSRFELISRKTYNNALIVAMELYYLTGENSYRLKALGFSEKSKSALLRRMISDSRAKQFAGIPKKVLERENYLKKEIFRLELLLERDYLSTRMVSKIRRSALENSYYENRNSYQKLIGEKEKKYPKYFNLKFKDWSPDISEIQKSLNNGKVIIEYFMTNDMIYIFLITEKEFITKSVKIDSTFIDVIRNFYRSIVKIEESEFLKCSPLLYDKLIKPVNEYIIGKKKIVIIPDSELYFIPFEALISGKDNFDSFSNLDFLIKNHSFSYHYSMALKNKNANKSDYSNRNFLGFAPVFTWRTKALLGSKRKILPRLPGTAKEVRSIMDLFNSKGIGTVGYFYGDATESKFKEVLSDQEFGFIHVATHSVNNINPVLSGLIFADDPDGKAEEDGILFSKEIYNLKIKTSLLVLSCCESGMGKMTKGEGILSLNRGFFFSGAKNIIFSLWTVEDRSTSKLMVELYKNILNGEAFSESLKDAKLTLISNPYTAFPKYWSSFILFGK